MHRGARSARQTTEPEPSPRGRPGSRPPTPRGLGVNHDAEQHVVRDLKMGGLESKKGRRYLHAAYAEALPQYEGAVCNVDHVPESNPDVRFEARFGIWRNVRLKADGPWGDLHYNPAHALAESFVWWAAHCPSAVGFSHDALGESAIDADGTQVVKRIHRVYSIDLVANPATTNGLRESDMPDPLLNTEPAVPGDEMQWDDQLGDLVKSIFCDKGLDAAGKKKKIMQALKLTDAEESDDEPDEAMESEDGEDEMTDEKKKKDEDKMEESLKKLAPKHPSVKKALALLESNRKATQLVARKSLALAKAKKAGLVETTLSEVFVESLIHARDDKHMDALIEDRRKFAFGRVQKPVSASAQPGPANGGPVDQAQVDAFCAGLRS